MAVAKDTALIDSVRALRPLILEHAEAAEKARRVSTPVVDGMRDAGVFRTLVPRTFGGSEVHPAEFLGLIEDLATADASTAWVAMIGATSALTSAYIDEDAAREIFTPNTILAGVTAPRGMATPVEGGHNISWKSPFASGCEHSDYIALACPVSEQPSVLLAIVPMSQVKINDTWDVSGLRATGSHDVSVSDVFVPATHSFTLWPPTKPKHNAALFTFSMMGLLSIAVAGVALGAGRGALDDFREMAGAKTPTGRRKPLAEWSIAQAEYAQAEAALRSGRAFLVEAIDSMWDTIERGDRPNDEHRALVRLAATAATNGAVKAVDTAYNLAGGSAIYSKHALQRRFRDVHTLTAHVIVGTSSLEAAGRSLLGLTVPPGFL
jgi:alkylation response protein AidB-like acyl-CoA dehydrogenase